MGLDAPDAVSPVSQQFYCSACRTWYRTDGRGVAAPDDLWNELHEHQAELHD